MTTIKKKKNDDVRHLRSWSSGGRDLFPSSASGFDLLCVCLSSPRCFICLVGLWPCLFPGIHFPGNHFSNFPVFVCHQESWLTENTFRSTENTFQSTETLFGQQKTLSSQRKHFSNLVWFSGKCFPFWLCLFFGK